MGSTQIINHTSKPLDMKVGNCRHFTKVATVDTNKSYTVHSNYDDTYMEYTLGVDNGAGASPSLSAPMNASTTKGSSSGK